MIHINGKHYYTADETSGAIYDVTEDEDIGEEVGEFVNGVANFNA
jgi:hypothetical protein